MPSRTQIDTSVKIDSAYSRTNMDGNPMSTGVAPDLGVQKISNIAHAWGVYFCTENKKTPLAPIRNLCHDGEYGRNREADHVGRD